MKFCAIILVGMLLALTIFHDAQAAGTCKATASAGSIHTTYGPGTCVPVAADALCKAQCAEKKLGMPLEAMHQEANGPLVLDAVERCSPTECCCVANIAMID
jgi:hypothetical protein